MKLSKSLMPIAYRLLENEHVYDSYQTCVGSVRYRRRLIQHLASPDVLSFLDIGCGTASTVDLIPKNSEYFGIDISEKYLERASQKRSNLNLIRGDVSNSNWIEAINLSKPTMCIALGIFHHLSDLELISMLDNCLKVLPKGSQIFSMDPIVTDSSSWGAKWFADNDRGKYVRDIEHLEELFLSKNLAPSFKVMKNQMRIPLDTVEISIKL